MFISAHCFSSLMTKSATQQQLPQTQRLIVFPVRMPCHTNSWKTLRTQYMRTNSKLLEWSLLLQNILFKLVIEQTTSKVTYLFLFSMNSDTDEFTECDQHMIDTANSNSECIKTKTDDLLIHFLSDYVVATSKASSVTLDVYPRFSE